MGPTLEEAFGVEETHPKKAWGVYWKECWTDSLFEFLSRLCGLDCSAWGFPPENWESWLFSGPASVDRWFQEAGLCPELCYSGQGPTDSLSPKLVACLLFDHLGCISCLEAFVSRGWCANGICEPLWYLQAIWTWSGFLCFLLLLLFYTLVFVLSPQSRTGDNCHSRTKGSTRKLMTWAWWVRIPRMKGSSSCCCPIVGKVSPSKLTSLSHSP